MRVWLALAMQVRRLWWAVPHGGGVGRWCPNRSAVRWAACVSRQRTDIKIPGFLTGLGFFLTFHYLFNKCSDVDYTSLATIFRRLAFNLQPGLWPAAGPAGDRRQWFCLEWEPWPYFSRDRILQVFPLYFLLTQPCREAGIRNIPDIIQDCSFHCRHRLKGHHITLKYMFI